VKTTIDPCRLTLNIVVLLLAGEIQRERLCNQAVYCSSMDILDDEPEPLTPEDLLDGANERTPDPQILAERAGWRSALSEILMRVEYFRNVPDQPGDFETGYNLALNHVAMEIRHLKGKE